MGGRTRTKSRRWHRPQESHVVKTASRRCVLVAWVRACGRRLSCVVCCSVTLKSMEFNVYTTDMVVRPINYSQALCHANARHTGASPGLKQRGGYSQAPEARGSLSHSLSHSALYAKIFRLFCLEMIVLLVHLDQSQERHRAKVGYRRWCRSRSPCGVIPGPHQPTPEPLSV